MTLRGQAETHSGHRTFRRRCADPIPSEWVHKAETWTYAARSEGLEPPTF
jgi:hypothetical protein